MSAKDDAGHAGPTEEQRRQAAEAADSVPDEGYDCPIDFNTFVLSLSASAAMHLGLAPNPMTGQAEVSLPLARQTIDLLTLLESKTEGNLTGEEERLLAQVLYDLRMQYVARSETK
jgi:hypothetical protein